MEKFLSLSLSGLATGAIYSILASGLVLTYITSGIFNFAHGAVAFATAYLYYQLNTGLGVPIIPALIISVFLFAPLLGLLLDRILLRRLAQAPVYARIVGTIGLLVALPNLIQWLVIAVGNDALGLGLKGNEDLTSGLPVPGVGPTPPHQYRLIKGVVLDTNQIAVFAVAAIAAIVLWLVIRHSRAGLEMRAVVDREQLAGLRGVNAARTSALAWVMTMVLAGLAGVLIAPLFQLQDTLITFVVLGSLAAVVLGGLRSIPIAFAGGLLLGVVQNLFAGYSDSFLPDSLNRLSGLQSAVPYILVILFLLVFGRDRSRRAGSASDEKPRPDHREGLPAWRRRLPWVVFTVALIAFSLQWFHASWLQADDYDQTVIALSLVMGIVFLSFVVVTGMGGMVSLAQATFVTAGGFAGGWALSRDWGVNVPGIAAHGQINFFWALVIGTIAAAGLGALFAWPLSKLGGVTLALGTLALAFFFYFVPFGTDDIGKGQLGWTMRAPTLDVPGLNWVHDVLIKGDQPKIDMSQLQDQILVFLVLFGLLTLVIHALQRSASGRAMLAVRSSEVAAEASGVRANRTKIMIFALSAAIAGFGGVLLGVYSFSFSNTTAPPYVGLFWLALAVTFGIRRPAGALLAGFALAAGPAVFHWIANWSILGGGTANALIASIYFVPILSGLGAIQLAQEPDGILALVGQQRLRKKREKERQARLAAAEAAAHDGVVPEHEILHTNAAEVAAAPPSSNGEPAADVVLSIEGVIAGYGDAEVLHGVSLRLSGGSVVALLGANGAGKSTLCSVAAGLVDPTFGTIRLGGRDITHTSSYQRARDGLLLVPEARGIFPGLTVEENLTVLLRDPALRQQAFDRFPILAQRRKQVAGLLSGGEQQMLSLAPALADPPKVLIADEPTLGLAPLAAEAVIDAITELRDAGTAVLLVEEHAENALQVADRVAFMELGRIVWSGPRAEADMELLATAYLGAARVTEALAMTAAPRFADGTDIGAVVDALQEHGAVLVDQMIGHETVGAINREVDDAVAAAEPGIKTVNAAAQAFFGPHTKHVSSLAAVSPTFANEVMTHPTYLAACDRVLLPQCSRYRLNLGHLIVRGPGAQAQIPHRDEDVWPHFPRPHADIQIASILALVDFRAENGATRVVPGSHRWDRSRRPEPDEIVDAVVPAGGAVIYLGSTIHFAGTNSTADEWRRGLHLSYTLGWLRTEENNVLGVPPRVARHLTPEAQALLGYAVHDAIADGGGYLGMVHMCDPMELLESGDLE